MDRGREAGNQGQGIHFHRDGAIPEWFLELDGDQAFLGEGDVLLGDRRPQHVVMESTKLRETAPSKRPS
jgi:hypothetical protein